MNAPVFRFIAPAAAQWLAITVLCLVLAVPALGQGAGAPASAAASAKEKIAVMGMRGVGADDAEREAISDRLREVLLKTRRFTVVDRSQMEAVLTEQALQQTTCSDQECAVTVGKILGVGKIVAGRVVKFGEDRWQVSAQMVDVQTAVTLRADSIRFKGDIFGLLDTQVPLLAQKLLAPLAAAPAAPSAAPAVAASAAPMAVPAGPKLQKIRGTWIDGPPLLVGRAQMGAVTLGPRVIVVGGEGERGEPLDSVEALDAGADKWHELNPLPEARSAPAVVVVAGHIYAIGGRRGQRVLNRVDIYDPAADRWVPGPALPRPREGALALASGGRLFLVGGMNADGDATDETLMLDAGSGQWRAMAPLKQARAFAVGETVDGRLMVMGGRRGSSGLTSLMGSVMVKAGEQFDPEANRWSPVSEMPKGLVGMSGALIGPRFYLFGGLSGSFAVLSPQGTYEAYDVNARKWVKGGRMPTGRAEHATVVLPDRVLLIGGKPGQYRNVTELR